MCCLQLSPVQVFEKIPALLYLYAQGNQLKEVPSGLPASLEQLRLSKNRISKIPAGAFNKMGNLTMLDLYYNQVKLCLNLLAILYVLGMSSVNHMSDDFSFS